MNSCTHVQNSMLEQSTIHLPGQPTYLSQGHWDDSGASGRQVCMRGRDRQREGFKKRGLSGPVGLAEGVA